MGWLDDINNDRYYKYRSEKDEILGKKKDYRDFGLNPTFEPGDKFVLNDVEYHYAGFEPYRLLMCTRVGGEGSDRQIASMQKSFREHFVKHELDDVRHKHGKAIDDSLKQSGLMRKATGRVGDA